MMQESLERPGKRRRALNRARDQPGALRLFGNKSQALFGVLETQIGAARTLGRNGSDVPLGQDVPGRLQRLPIYGPAVMKMTGYQRIRTPIIGQRLVSIFANGTQ